MSPTKLLFAFHSPSVPIPWIIFSLFRHAKHASLDVLHPHNIALACAAGEVSPSRRVLGMLGQVPA